jgi:hypothetical protein
VAAFNWGNDLDGAALTATTAGTPLPSTLKSGSRRCLGCHDGTVALGDVWNAADGAPGVIGGFADLAGRVAGGMLTGNLDLVTGASMGGNHPISIPYAGQAAGYNGLVASRAVADGAVGNYFAAAVAGCTSSSTICTSAPATDGRNGAQINLVRETAGSAIYGVECSSCHEPHNRWNYPAFTRVNNTVASGLCRSCHNK